VAAAKKKPIQASEVVVGNRSLEAVLIDLAEQVKTNDARSAQSVERSARAEEQAALALKAIATLSQDFIALVQEIRAHMRQTDARLGALEARPPT
jgi:hypothetical protein